MAGNGVMKIAAVKAAEFQNFHSGNCELRFYGTIYCILQTFSTKPPTAIFQNHRVGAPKRKTPMSSLKINLPKLQSGIFFFLPVVSKGHSWREHGTGTKLCCCNSLSKRGLDVQCRCSIGKDYSDQMNGLLKD